MRISFNKYPVDIILCMLWSFILIPVALLAIEGILRIILGLPFVLFIPGYVLIFALFPTRKKDRGIDVVERIAISFGLSMAVVPLIGFALNYSPWGIQLEPILLSIFIFIIGVGTIAIYRWFKAPPDDRFTISLDVYLPKSECKLDKILTIILTISIILASATFVYVVTTPKRIEQITEFYLLDSSGRAEDYPRYLSLGENATVIIGITNHEYRDINYTVEVWLINQSIYYNESEDVNKTIIHNMWFLDKITTTLDRATFDPEQSWSPQWQYNYSFAINRKGSFKLTFLLFTAPTKNYSLDMDYKHNAEEKISSAYYETHLWIDVEYTEFYLLEPDGLVEEYPINRTIGEHVNGTLGISNHEYKTINYTVEVWLVNQSTYYNESEDVNKTIIHNMWFLDKITTTLDRATFDPEQSWSPQWQYNYSFAINRTGLFKLLILLFPIPTEGYIVDEDYGERAEIKFKSAYKDLYIWLDVT